MTIVTKLEAQNLSSNYMFIIALLMCYLPEYVHKCVICKPEREHYQIVTPTY